MKNFFKAGVPAHCYQKGINGNVLFYSQIDRLVYFTIYAVEAKKRGIRTLALCLMTDHTHSLLIADSSTQLSLFNRNVEAKYAFAFNKLSRKRGVVFMPYGHAFKAREKDIRTCIIYIANNPVEKRKFAYAEQDRWTFLAYADNRAPFSEPFIARKASTPMKKAIAMVQGAYSQSVRTKPIIRIRKAVSPRITSAPTRIAAKLPSPAAIRYFGTMNKMLTAIHSTTGSEHDLSEERDTSSETVYLQMQRKAQAAGYSLFNKDFLSLEGNDYRNLVRLLLSVPEINPFYLGRFLHQPIKVRSDNEINEKESFSEISDLQSIMKITPQFLRGHFQYSLIIKELQKTRHRYSFE